MSKIKRIPIDKLEIGMYVSKHTKGIADNKLKEGGIITHQRTIDKLLQKSLVEIYIDVEKGKDSQFSIPVNTSPPAYKPTVPLAKERERAAAIHSEALGLVDNLMHDVKVGKAVDVAPMEKLADEISSSVFNNQNALLCLSQIREKDRYLLEHSVNVGILMAIFSRHLGYDDHTVHQLITGALLHDIGKIQVPDTILNKPGRLTADEWTEMKRHVAYGQKVLLKSEGISDIALAICGQHHERLDGSGYPLGLNDHELSIHARLAAIVDVYDAITASRVYRDGMTPSVAMKRLVEWSDNHLDRTLVYDFIRCMSVYPVGTLVELDNGKLGTIIQTHSTMPDRPIVRIFYNMRHNHYEAPVELDLSKKLVETKIIGARDPKEMGIALGDFL